VLKAHLSIALVMNNISAIDRCAFNTAGMNKLKIIDCMNFVMSTAIGVLRDAPEGIIC